MELFGDDINVDGDRLFKEHVCGSVISTGHTGSLYNHWKFVRKQQAEGGFIRLQKSRKRKKKNKDCTSPIIIICIFYFLKILSYVSSLYIV